MIKNDKNQDGALVVPFLVHLFYRKINFMSGREIGFYLIWADAGSIRNIYVSDNISMNNSGISPPKDTFLSRERQP